MSIATGGGDGGETGLWTGTRVKKHSPRVEAYGVIDELGAFAGSARHSLKIEESLRVIDAIQSDLFSVAGELASDDGRVLVSESDVKRVTQLIHDYEGRVELKGFVVPGQTPGAAALDLCRVTARRAEREISRLNESAGVNPELMKYVNRLSDLFFIMARCEEYEAGVLTYMIRRACED